MKIAEQWGDWHRDASWKLNLEFAEKQGVELIPYSSSRYPKRLLEIPDHPIMLYVKGQITSAEQGIADLRLSTMVRLASAVGEEVPVLLAKPTTTN